MLSSRRTLLRLSPHSRLLFRKFSSSRPQGRRGWGMRSVWADPRRRGPKDLPSGIPTVSWSMHFSNVKAKARDILKKALTEPTPTVAAIQQFGALSILLSYATKDVIALRALAISGIVFFNMVPNYFKMNYANICWGAAFLALNSYRLVELVREQTATTKSLGFTEDELLVYEQRFHRHITPRCFRRIMKFAEWREVPEGRNLFWKNGPVEAVGEEMCILVRGRAELYVQGDRREATVFQAKPGTIVNIPQLSKTHPSSESISKSVPENDVEHAHDTERIGSDAVGSKSISKEDAMTSPKNLRYDAPSAVVESQVPQPAAAAKGGASSENSPSLKGKSKDVQQEQNIKEIPTNKVQSSASKLGTRAIEPTTVVVWRLADLMTYLENDDVAFSGLLQIFNEALLENVLERDQMRVNDKYEALLRRAISEVGEGGTLPAGQKMALADFRQRHGITTWMHNKALEDLGWTAEDYNSGARFDRDRAHKALKTLSKKLQPRIDSVPGAAVQEVRKEVEQFKRNMTKKKETSSTRDKIIDFQTNSLIHLAAVNLFSNPLGSNEKIRQAGTIKDLGRTESSDKALMYNSRTIDAGPSSRSNSRINPGYTYATLLKNNKTAFHGSTHLAKFSEAANLSAELKAFGQKLGRENRFKKVHESQNTEIGSSIDTEKATALSQDKSNVSNSDTANEQWVSREVQSDPVPAKSTPSKVRALRKCWSLDDYTSKEKDRSRDSERNLQRRMRGLDSLSGRLGADLSATFKEVLENERAKNISEHKAVAKKCNNRQTEKAEVPMERPLKRADSGENIQRSLAEIFSPLNIDP